VLKECREEKEPTVADGNRDTLPDKLSGLGIEHEGTKGDALTGHDRQFTPFGRFWDYSTGLKYATARFVQSCEGPVALPDSTKGDDP